MHFSDIFSKMLLFWFTEIQQNCIEFTKKDKYKSG